MGRPSSYTPEIGERICERLESGDGLAAICREDDMPSQSMVYRWLEANDAFRERYERARERQQDFHAEQLLEIADDGRNDWMERNGEDDRGWQANGEHIQRSRLRVDARKWLMSKLAPKKYGDVQQHKHTGPDDGPVQIEHSGRAAELLAELAAGKAGGHRGAAAVDQGRKTEPDPAAG